MSGWKYWFLDNKLDQSIIVYSGDFTMQLDLANRSFVMEVDNQKITIDGNIGDFDYSPIVILLNLGHPLEVHLL